MGLSRHAGRHDCLLAKGAAALLALGTPGAARAIDLLSADFTTDPRISAGWTYTGAADAGWSLSGSITAEDISGALYVWRSPEFAVTPDSYYQVIFDGLAPVKGFAATVWSNPAPTYGNNPPSEDLIADHYSSVGPSTTFTQQTFFARSLPNAVQGSVVFQPITSNIGIDNVHVAAATHAQVAAWADTVYAGMKPLNYIPPATRLANLSRTSTRLEAGQALNIVTLGDSIMNDLSSSAFETLVERRYPGSSITVSPAVGGGAGMDKWNPDNPAHTSFLNLQKSVIDQAPDLVIIGGISNGTAYNDIRHVIDLVRSGVSAEFGYTPDILLLTGAFGDAATSNPLAPGSTWYPTIDPAGTDYRSTLFQISQQKATGFLDMNGAWGQYMIAAQNGVYDPTAFDSFYRDPVHADSAGEQIMGRILDAELSPLSVPAGNGTWKNGANDGLWDTHSSANNWVAGIPNASGQIATFADTAAGGTTPGTVNLVTPKTIGGIVFNTATAGYTLGTGASPSLTLQVASGSASIQVFGGGSHTIAAATIIASNTTINVDGGSLTFANGIESASWTLSFTGPGAVDSAGITSSGVITVAGAGAHNFGNIAGSPGTPHLVGIVNTIGTAAQLSLAGITGILGNAQVITTSIRQNTLNIGDGTSTNAKVAIADSSPAYAENSLVPSGNDAFVSVVRNLTIANSGGFKGTLDLGNNDLIIDYTGGSSPVTSIEAMVASGYNGGLWTGKGITSSAASQNTGRFALTVIDNFTAANHFDTFDGVDTSTHQQVFVKFSWVADLDLDGVITSNDAITFSAHYSEGSFANHQTGDLNYNGVFDSNDAILFAAAYNESLPHLPEPASLGILALGIAGLLCRRR